MKQFLIWFSLGCILLCGVYGMVNMGGLDRTYEPADVTVPVYELQQNPDAFDDTNADGAAAAIVQQDLAKAHSVNAVTAIVFDFRGYDTMGEAFILITAVAGSAVILAGAKKKEEKEGKQDE